MSAAYEPGTVALAKVKGYTDEPRRVIRGYGDQWWGPGLGLEFHSGKRVEIIRVLDVVERVEPEPLQLGAVVRDAKGRRFVRTYSIATDNAAWVTGTHRLTWDEIDSPVVLSEGIPDTDDGCARNRATS